MPDILWDIDTIKSILLAEDCEILQFSFIVVGGDFHFAFQDNDSFVFRRVAVDGYLCAWFQRIEPSGREHL